MNAHTQTPPLDPFAPGVRAKDVPVAAKTDLSRVLFPPTPNEPIVEHALHYASLGWHVFPAPIGTKKSHKSADRSDGRKWGMTIDPVEIKRDFKF